MTEKAGAIWQITKEKGCQVFKQMEQSGQNRKDGFSSLQFFNSAGVHEFAIPCKVVTRF